MKRSLVVLVVALLSAAGHAASIDMNDPRRAVGTDNDIRIDAQLTTEFVSPHAPIAVTYQIQNLSPRTIAVADKACEASYDADSRTITLSIGSEVPKDGEMPRLLFVRPGQKRTFTVGANLYVRMPGIRTPRTTMPGFVQIKVNVLRDLEPFAAVMNSEGAALSDAQFEQWLTSNESIFLNVIPIRYRPADENRISDASQR